MQELKKDWWKKEVIYQIYPKSFNDSNEDGIGDLEGIRQKLPYLKDLGVTMIWICPIFKSPMHDNGYDIADYEDIDPQFGTMDDFDLLLNEATKLDIKIILDLVVNHTSDEHEWFQKALADKNSKYRAYYIFKEGKERPNNWRSQFGGSAWEKVPGEDAYYLHLFGKEQPDLNWENPELRQEIYDMINRWLEKGIAGFRIDSITFIKKDQDFASLPADGVDGLVSCKSKTRNRPGIGEFLNELKRETFEKYNCVTVGEASGVDYKDYEEFIGKDGYFSMIFDFHYADIDVESGTDWFKRSHWQVRDFKELLAQSQETIQQAGWAANFIENHDQPRALSKLVHPDFQNARSACGIGALYFFLRGTPFVYQGQELGMINAERRNIEEFDDISSIDNYYRGMEEGYSKEEALHFVNLRSRDNTRSPMPWNNEKYGGFSQVQPWLEMTEEYPTTNTQGSEVIAFYQKMIALRQTSEISQILIHGTIEFLSNVAENVIAYVREYNGERVYSFTNLGTDEEEVIWPKDIEQIFVNTHNNKNQDIGNILSPYQSILFK
ncbi:glucosidase [Tetragenococcus halophilus subsp. halophilus]|uniref:glycoside hydrolase family 13 protein n=1 Tax=Tetragenococcus halophilus TaxID=51669 RepID=UPI000CC90F71|nr:alpha-glucosidase [Tetragenococcus halophilus]GBD83305.1 glucosidase [Tetragenococcus halophilus subsp. halophilus]GFK28709.1 alpha-glucosidase [Tetragenococcus halophilus]GLL51180.1 glycosyl hydrolase [Tetragenococcus halophilus]